MITFLPVHLCSRIFSKIIFMLVGPNRGEYKYTQDSNLLWQHTKTVSCVSTNQSPEVSVRRRQDGRRVEVPCLLPIKIYNRYIGGVDKNDQICGYYSVRTKSRKSYKYLFWFLFDVAIVNSFILYALSPAIGRRKTERF